MGGDKQPKKSTKKRLRTSTSAKANPAASSFLAHQGLALPLPSLPPPLPLSQPRPSTSQSSSDDSAFDVNTPYGVNLAIVAQEIFSPDALRRLQHVAEELNPVRPTQAAVGVPVHESVKIALGTLLSVSNSHLQILLSIPA